MKFNDKIKQIMHFLQVIVPNFFSTLVQGDKKLVRTCCFAFDYY